MFKKQVFISLCCLSIVPRYSSYFVRTTTHCEKSLGTRLMSSKGPKTSDNTRTPRRFYVEPSNLLNIAASAAPILFRLGSGVFVNGYKVEIDIESDDYAVLSAFGKRVKESSTTMPNRPKLPIELYEFDGCPFCKKV